MTNLKDVEQSAYTAPVSDEAAVLDISQVLTDLEEIREAVFGSLGSEPDVYSDYDRLCELSVKMRLAIRALQPQPAVKVDEWQPIETAPRDGAKFLSIGMNGSVVMAKWCDECDFWIDCIDGHLRGEWQPTHWMPLPAAPRLDGEGGAV